MDKALLRIITLHYKMEMMHWAFIKTKMHTSAKIRHQNKITVQGNVV